MDSVIERSPVLQTHSPFPLDAHDRYVTAAEPGSDPYAIARFISGSAARLLRDAYRAEMPAATIDATTPSRRFFDRGLRTGIDGGVVFRSFRSVIVSRTPSKALLARVGVQYVGDTCWSRFDARFEIRAPLSTQVRATLDACTEYWTRELNPWRTSHARRGEDSAYSLFRFDVVNL